MSGGRHRSIASASPVRSGLARAGATALVLAAGLLAWGHEPPARARTFVQAEAEYEWSFRYADGDKGRAAVEAAVDEVVGEMNGLIRGLARRKLLEANEIIGTIGVSVSGDTLRASYIGGRVIESPASGAAVPWVNEFGETVKVSQRWSDRTLTQRIFNDAGSRTNVYRFSEDGTRMTMSVTVEASQLPGPIRYRLHYRRKGE